MTADVAPDGGFLYLAAEWTRLQAETMLHAVWQGYEAMCASMPHIHPKDLERSITQSLATRIQDALTGDEPFSFQHGAYEHETQLAPPAQPPQYDLAFILRSNERIKWPLEAKVMNSTAHTGPYVADVRDQFLTCRYAPFTGAGAMIGYLLDGEADEALVQVGRALYCTMSAIPAFDGQPHRVSTHDRVVPQGKAYPAEFVCHHLVLTFHGLRRIPRPRGRTRRGEGA